MCIRDSTSYIAPTTTTTHHLPYLTAQIRQLQLSLYSLYGLYSFVLLFVVNISTCRFDFVGSHSSTRHKLVTVVLCYDSIWLTTIEIIVAFSLSLNKHFVLATVSANFVRAGGRLLARLCACVTVLRRIKTLDMSTRSRRSWQCGTRSIDSPTH